MVSNLSINRKRLNSRAHSLRESVISSEKEGGGKKVTASYLLPGVAAFLSGRRADAQV